MDEAHLEELVADFLDRRDQKPDLTPSQYIDTYCRELDGPEARKSFLMAVASVDRIVRTVADAVPDAPYQIGPYRIVAEIGRGGMGIVYEVESDQGAFALKLIPVAPLASPRVLERFHREVETLARLSHPNIVSIHDTGTEGGVPFFVMDLVRGKPLLEHAKEIGIPESLRLAQTLALTMAQAHEQGVIHRDLKPQNVMVREDGTPVILDFGLTTGDDFPSLTSTGDRVGTPRYMAPEQAQNGHADSRSDLYALGLILYELVVGRPAYDQRSRDTVIDAVSSGRFRRPRQHRPEIPRDVEKIILQAVALNPSRRYPDATAFAADLENALAGRPVVARPPGAAARVLRVLGREPLKVAVVLLFVSTALLLFRGLFRESPEDASPKTRTTASSPRPSSPTVPRPDDGVGSLASGQENPDEVPSGESGRNEASREDLSENPADSKGEKTKKLEAESPDGSSPAISAPFSDRPEMLRGLELWVDRDYEESQESLETALGRDPEDRIARALLADLRRESMIVDQDPLLEELQSGLDAYRSKKNERAVESFRKVLALDPGNPLAQVMIGRISTYLFRWEDAWLQFRAVAPILPRSSYVARKLGWVLYRMSRYDESVTEYERARGLDPNSYRVWREMADALFHQGNLEEARNSVNRALKLRPRDDSGLNLKGMILNALGERAEARAIYFELLERRPSSIAIRANLAYSFDQDHRGRDAERTYLDILEREPDHVSCLVSLALLYSGASRGKCGSCDEMFEKDPSLLDQASAEDLLVKALELSRGRQDRINKNSLDVALNLTRRDRVIETLERILREDPPSVSTGRLRSLLEQIKIRARSQEGGGEGGG